MHQPAALTARMNANMPASRPHSRADSSVRTLRNDAATDRTALHPRTGVRREPGQATGLIPEGTSPLRDSAGFAPDFAGLAATPGTPPEASSTVLGPSDGRQA